MQQALPSSSFATNDLAGLLAQVALRDRSAFAVLYQATSLKLYGTVLRILKRKDMAEDVLQDVYVKIWENAGSFSAARGSPIAWMAAIARNRALDELRRVSHVVANDVFPAIEDIAADIEHPLDARERSEEHARLMACLSQLEEEKRKMILLAYEDGCSRDDLARQFNRPVATVKTWLRRSLDSLKQCLSR